VNNVLGQGPVSGIGNGMGAGAAQPDYNGMAVPSVWRTNRTQAAAKVDALSSGGMDDFEIPAFLRKQAD
jgi:cell division protein FtsZ